MPDVIFLFSLLGFFDALYFTLAYYGRLRRVRWIPEIFCAREGSTCVTVLRTRYARLAGIPNSVLGLAYYLYMMNWAISDCPVGYEFSFGARLHIGWILILVSFLTVVLGFYLVWALRAKLRVHCPLCYAAHTINFVLFVMVLLVFA